MNKSVFYSTFTIITIVFSLNFIGACSTTESENIKTSGIWVHYKIVENTDGDIYAYAVLRVGGSTGTMVDLVGDDSVECNEVKLTEYVELITGYRWNRAEVSYDGDPLTITWDNSTPGTYVDINLSGICINDISQLSLEDDGEYTFSNIIMMDTTQETDCDVNIKISRIYEQDINPAFQGGLAEGIAKDASSLRIYSDPAK
jgi:hypothetical protein